MDNFNNPENNTPNTLGGTAFGNVTPQDAAPAYGTSQDTAPVYNVYQDTAPVYNAPQDAAPAYNAPQDTAPVYSAPQDTAPVYSTPSSDAAQTNTYTAQQTGNFTGATAEWQANHQTTTNGNDIYGAPYANQFATPASSYQAAAAPKKDKTGIAFAIISLVCGIFGLICCCLLGIWSLIITIPGLVLGIISLIKKFAGKGMAIAGVICSGLAIVLAIVLAIFSALGLSYLNDYMDDLGYSYDYNY